MRDNIALQPQRLAVDCKSNVLCRLASKSDVVQAEDAPPQKNTTTLNSLFSTLERISILPALPFSLESRRTVQNLQHLLHQRFSCYYPQKLPD
jgi:hypothetical protein